MSTYVWHCLINSGLDIYSGFLHKDRPGKPSLVLDIMEEYRAWVVDRAIVKLRATLSKSRNLDQSHRKRIVDEIDSCFLRKYPYHGKKVTLESILQRQIYRIAGHFFGDRKYKPYTFKW